MALILPISAIIPTYNRDKILKRTFQSLSKQSNQPAEIIIVDASDNYLTHDLCSSRIDGLDSSLIWAKADEKGAAKQRNKGVKMASHEYILFLDDDIILEDNCLLNLYQGIHKDRDVGAVGAFVTNQTYQEPGKLTKFMYKLMSGQNLPSYAGKCIGPAWNIWPECNESSPESIHVEWLSTVCALYRKSVLGDPVFPDFFKGYSYMEDVYLSLIVSKKKHIYILKNAKIFHDSQPGDHKKNVYKLSRMQLINRYYVMRYGMQRNTLKDFLKFLFLELFMITSSLRKFRIAVPYTLGKLSGILYLLSKRKSIFLIISII